MRNLLKQKRDMAVRLAGGEESLALAIGINRSAIYHWLKIPEKRLLAVSNAIGGAMTPRDMRPDLSYSSEGLPLVTQILKQERPERGA